MSQKIIDQARILADLIAESEELNKVRQAEASLASDPVAQDLINEFQTLHAKEREEKQAGNDLNAEDRAKFDAVGDQVENNATISTYLNAQEAFNSMMDAVNYLLMKGINGDADGCDTEGCSGGCSGCGH